MYIKWGGKGEVGEGVVGVVMGGGWVSRFGRGRGKLVEGDGVGRQGSN